MEYFFREYTDVLYYRALGFVKDNLAAEDIVQEVFIRFWQLRKNLKITDSVPGYLCKAVDHRCHNYLEHLKVKHRYEESQRWEEMVEEVPEDEDELNIMRERLKVFVDSLPEKCREIFVLACIEGLKYREVAERLDVSVNTVKTQLKSAYSKLRTEFNEKDLEIIALDSFDRTCIVTTDSQGPDREELTGICPTDMDDKAVNYLIKTPGGNIYHSGDSHYSIYFAKHGKDYDIDVAFGSYGENPIGMQDKMTSCDILRMAEALRCKVVIPIHYDVWTNFMADVNEIRVLYDMKKDRLDYQFHPFFWEVGGKYIYPQDKDKRAYHHRRGFEDCFEAPQNIPYRSCL